VLTSTDAHANEPSYADAGYHFLSTASAFFSWLG